MKEYFGAIHVHTNFSDGSGKLREIAKAAKKAGLDFIVTADHDTLRAKEVGFEGWVENVLVIIGVEISRTKEHALALNLKNCSKMKYMTTSEYLNEIERQNAEAFIVHPLGKKRTSFSGALGAWEHWNSEKFAGIEIWSYMHDWIEGINLGNIVDYYLNPEKKISGPKQDLLAKWDKLCQKRKVNGIASLDNHARKFPLFKIKFFPYKKLFHTLRTHVITDELNGDSNGDVQKIIGALSNGNCFLGYDYLANSTGFKFELIKNGKRYLQGTETKNSPKSKLHVKTPKRALIKLVKDGEAIEKREGDEFIFKSGGRGVYRIEAFLNNDPWIFSNPIYLR